jgi:spore coat polysaccharide biosynthesis protein SpsF
MSKIVMIIQARMGSVRLPGKSMMDLAGAPLVGRILERVKRCSRLDEIVLAIPDTPENMPLRQLGGDYCVKVFSGSEHDLLERFYQAAIWTKADYIVRLPADNATPEPSEIDRIIEHHISLGRPGFSSNLSVIQNNEYPDGIGAEIFDFELLISARQKKPSPKLREHIHLNFFDYSTGQPVDAEEYPISTIKCPKAFRRPDLVLDVNTLEQYEFICQLYNHLYSRNPQFHITDTIKWYDQIYQKSSLEQRRGACVTKSADYHDYVFRDGELVGEFEEMYRNSATTPWHQDEQEEWIDIRLTIEMLQDLGQFNEIHDFGCGTGHYLELISKHSLEPEGKKFGYDVSETACKKASSLFPLSKFSVLDLTQPTTNSQQTTTYNEQAIRLFVIRGTLWYVFPKLATVVKNISNRMRPPDRLLVVQNFPPLQSSFVGKDVLPDHLALLTQFSPHFVPNRHIWYEDRMKDSNDNWFIGLFSPKSKV